MKPGLLCGIWRSAHVPLQQAGAGAGSVNAIPGANILMLVSLVDFAGSGIVHILEANAVALIFVINTAGVIFAALLASLVRVNTMALNGALAGYNHGPIANARREYRPRAVDRLNSWRHVHSLVWMVRLQWWFGTETE